MRIVLGLLLAVGVVLQLLLGGSLVFSSTGENTGGLSDVSADLVSAEQLEQMKSEEAHLNARLDPYRDLRLGLGIALLALAVLQIVSAVMAFKGRSWALVLAGTGLSLAAALSAVIMVFADSTFDSNRGLEVLGLARGMEFYYITAGVLFVALLVALGSKRKKGTNA